MKAALDDLYNSEFYKQHVPGMSTSSQTVLGVLYQYFKPESVVDVGCGRGAWLASAGALGSKVLKGFDGRWVKKTDLLSPDIDFTEVDFDAAMPKIEQKYDLAISLEVAEHVSEANAKKFVDTLCKASDIILFSAAIRYQGGTNHINEQWQSYWIELFRQNGYDCFDIIRPAVWSDKSVEWWYKQNSFVFCSANGAARLDAQRLRAAEKPVANLVHPAIYEEKIESFNRQIEFPSFSFCVNCIKRFLANKLAGRRPA